jgi:uncharacterized membrane protein
VSAPAPSRAERRGSGLERTAAALLRGGVWTSLGLVATGLVLGFVRHPEYRTDAEVLRRLTAPGAAFPHDLSEVLTGLGAGEAQAVVTTGLLLLIATPVLRVATSFGLFVRRRDALFAGLTATVLALLLLSIALGRAG